MLHEILYEDFFLYCIEELGRIKTIELSKKINQSNAIHKFIQKTHKMDGYIPNPNEFVACIHSSRYFTFSKSEIIAFTSVMLLELWYLRVAKPKNLITNQEVNVIFWEILKKCESFKIKINNKPNFYSRFNERFISKIL
tara:strand:- start:51 stop:467 length:417 start_codon:yes stop_codon:yes gene_type:complete